jgi:RNA polymerase sigma-70 factor, ECF subfamily
MVAGDGPGDERTAALETEPTAAFETERTATFETAPTATFETAPTATFETAPTATFERARVTSMAYRMLGSWAEAEDAVQEAWLRFAAADAEIHEPAAWLTTVVTRICLDVLRSARVRREVYVGPWLPEPLVEALPSGELDPADASARGEEVGMALLVLLERLTPEQRAAFVLHDVFAVGFDEIAAALGTSPAAARQRASRARRMVMKGGLPRRRADLAEQRRVVTAFLAATQTGDLDGLLAVLAPDVVMVGDGGGIGPAGRHPIHGAEAAARFLLGLFRRAAAEMDVDLQPVLVNGDLGLLVEARARDGRTLPASAGDDAQDTLRFTMAFTFVDGRISAIYDQLNPQKLTHVPRIRDLKNG